MTSVDAARMLGVSTRQVRRLVGSGALIEADRIGGNLLLDTNSVHRLVARGSQRGRPWDAHVAWAAIDILDTGRTKDLTAAQRSRLRARLRRTTARELVRLARGRAIVQRYRATPSVVDRLRRNVTLTGDSAVAADRATADVFGLAATGTGTVDGYVAHGLLDAYRDEFFLVTDHNGNVTLRVTDQAALTQRLASETVVALDLAESLHTRERAAGLELLERKLRSA